MRNVTKRRHSRLVVPRLVADAMHRGVITCSSGSSAITAARIMAAHHIHAVLVVGTDRRCSGMVTDAEVVRAMASGTIRSRTVDEIAAPPTLVASFEPLSHAVALMGERGSTHAVVVDPFDLPIGVLAALDLLEIIAEGEPAGLRL